MTEENFHERIQDKIQDKIQLSDENVLRLEKGKRGLLNVLFGRTTVILLMLLIQIGMIMAVYHWLEQYVTYFYIISIAVALCVCLHILNKAGDPTVKLTWMIIVMAMPVFGGALYLWIQMDIGHRILHRRLDQILASTKNYLQSDPDVLDEIRSEKPDLYELSVYMDAFGGYPVYQGCKVKYFPQGEDKFEDLLVELEKARDFIFLEYFIVDEGYMWGRILEILSRKVQEGVEVRVMYDGTCALYKLPYSYPKKLEALGIRCKMFAPLRPAVSTHYNNRDHRKILVIDGQTAYTGGVNLADEYINRRTLYGHWKDTAVKVQGDAVKSFTLMFLQMWNVDEKTEQYDRYLNRDFHILPPQKGYVLPYGDSPLDNERVGEMVYEDILNRAERYVHIMTPYLILDNEMITALSFAAKRGVEVQIILPHIPDKEYAFALAKTYYRQLMAAGVEIYEYLPGFVHAKVFVSDNQKAVVGTINLDYRSLYHHFECGLYMQDVEEIDRIELDFRTTRSKCKRMTVEDLKKEKPGRRLKGLLLKIFAPLM
ncbi:MAG: phospholipase D-like domain-containing protein [Firmicutes bacterium]|nr:phospholipase D-like domain-containing protein [Bacillota bacterium]